MKKAVSIILTAALVFTLAGCTDTAPPAVDDTSSAISSEITSSKEETSSIPESSEAPSSVIESSETPSSTAPVSSNDDTSSKKSASSKTSSYADDDPNRPVSPPKDPNAKELTPEELDAQMLEYEAERAEIRRLGDLPTTYTMKLEKEIYPIGTEEICVVIKNDGPGLLTGYSSYSIDKFDGSEWVNIVRPIPPTGMIEWKPAEETKSYYSVKDRLTEAGRYRICRSFETLDTKGKSGEKNCEFTLE